MPRISILCCFVPALVIMVAGCSRNPREPALSSFQHESPIVRSAPVVGGTWSLHGSTLLAFGGRSQQDDGASTELFLLDAATGAWRSNNSRLPAPLTDGWAAAGPDGVLVIDRGATEVASSLLWLGPQDAGFVVSVLPALPGAARADCGAAARGAAYVVATPPGARPRLFALSSPGSRSGGTWLDLGSLPPESGRPLALAVQRDGVEPRFWVLGSGPASSEPGLSTTIFSRPLGKENWTRHQDYPGTSNLQLMVPAGFAQLYVFAAGQPEGSAPTDWWVFNTITGTWVGPFTTMTAGTPVAARVAGTRLDLLSLGRDGGVTQVVARYETRTRALHWLDYMVLAAFAAGLLGIGWLHSRKGGSAEQYFRGGRNVNWLAAGLSIVATRLSATSFVSIPAKAFATNWQYSFVPLTNFVGAYIMSRWFVRFFMRLNVTSGYEYLEKRFHPHIRTLGSLNYLGYELARIGILILVPAVALSAVAKLDLGTTIVVIGLVVTAYTAVGGIEGVIWADTFQILVKVAGLLLATLLIFLQLQGNPLELAATAWHAGKLRVVDVSWDFTRDTLWVFLLFWLTDGLKSYVANQTIIQRFISTRDLGTAQRTIWTSAVIGTGVSWLLLLLGTGLFLFYLQNPTRLDLTMDKADAVFPWFIVFELPPGVVGILLAALIAAAMSSLDGALNSTSTVLVTDFYRRYHPHPTDVGAVRLGRYLTIGLGLLATVVALLMSGMANRSLFDQTLMVIGLLGGGLGGLFLLGMLTTRTSATAALVGFAASAGVQYYVSSHTSLHLLTYMFTGMGSCLLTGWLAGWLWPERRDLDGLTVHTCR